MTPTRAARVSSLRSMTGFGRAEVSAGPVAISVEARSLNHRHLDVTLRLPRALADLEMDARRLIQSRLERGRVEIAAQLSPAPDTPGQKISVDQALAADLRAQTDLVEARVPAAVARREARLRERIRALLGEAPIDQARILGEVAIWAEKTDVREELTRLRAHLEQCALVLAGGGAVGRPLDFLIQELNREVNTIASKADDLEVSQAALAAKGLIEKMREQVQNLE